MIKWIGEHIWDFVSRFRNDIYMESIPDGTIASGKNLGLDSSNKVVKSSSPSGSIDLTSEVTGTLPVANGGTGATSLNNLITLSTHTTGDYVASLTAGSLIDLQNNTGEGATPTIDVDLSELTDMTESWTTAEDEFVVLDNGTQRRKLSSEIFGSNAFTSTTIGTTTNALTFDDATVQLNTGTTFDGSAARTVSAKTAAISDGGTGLATADQIHTFVTTQTDAIDADTSGNAATATALATTRAFQTNLGSTSSANFDGTAANTHGVTGTLAVGNGGTGQTSVTDFKNVLDDETWSFANNVTLAGFVLDGNTITGVNDSSEFDDDDAHIMTSAAINDRFAQINADTTGQAGTVATIAGLAPNTATTQATQPNITTMTGVFTGSANQLLTDDGDGTVTSEANLTFNGSTLSIEADSNTTANGLFIDCNSLTTGHALEIDVDDAIGTTHTTSLAEINYNKSANAASGQTIIVTGLDINIDDDADSNAGDSLVYLTGVASTIDTVDDDPLIAQATCYSANVMTGPDSAYGLKTNLPDGSAFADIRMRSSASASDYAEIRTGANGALTIETTDGGGTDGHIELAADGDITLDSAGQIKLEPASGNNILLDDILTIDGPVVVPVATSHNAAGTDISIGAGSTTAGTTNNIAGGSLTIHGGQGKGTGAGGDIIFKTANAGASGSSLNSLATALTISDDLSSTFAGAIVGNLTGNADTATEATNITVSANNTANETVYPIFVDGATGTQGAESDTGLTYNPNSGMLSTGGVTAAAFVGDLQGEAETVATIAGLAPNTATTQATQPNITTMTGVFTGSANQLITDDGDGTVTSESTLTYDNGTLTATSSTDELPHLILDCTHAGTGGPVFSFKNTATGEDNDGLGRIYFSGSNAADQATTFASITGSITTAADTDEAGKLNINIAASNGSTSNERQALSATGHGTNDIVDIGLAYGTTSTTTVAGNLNVNGTDHTFTSATADKPVLSLTNTNTTSSSQASIQFIKDAADVSVGEYLGKIDWIGDNDAGTPEQITYATIFGRAHDETDGSEQGAMYLKVGANDGTSTAGITLEGGESVGIVKVNIPTREIDFNPGTTDGKYQSGDVVFFGGTTGMTTGKCYYLNDSGSWTITNADAEADASGLLAIALGADSDTNGMLLRGVVTPYGPAGTDDYGKKVYLRAQDGILTTAAPSSSGNIVRIVGYMLHDSDDAIYFCPDNTYVEIA